LIGRAKGGKGGRDSDEGEISEFGRLADFDAITEAGEEIHESGEFGEVQMHEAGAENEGANGIGIALFFTGEDLAQDGKRVSGRVSDDPGKWGGNFDVLPAAISLSGVDILPFIELNLSGDGFDGKAEFRAEIKRAESDVTKEFTEFGDVAIGVGDGFALTAFNGVTEDAAGAEEHGRSVEIDAQLLLAMVGDVFGKGVQLQKLLDIESRRGGRLIHKCPERVKTSWRFIVSD